MKSRNKIEPDGLDMDQIMGEFGGKWVDPQNDTDDRVKCEDCGNKLSVVAIMRMPMVQFERMRKVNHPAFHWFIEDAKIKDDWATAPMQRTYCKATGDSILPIPHRCHLFIQQAPQEAVNWLDDDETSPRGTQRAGKAGDVGARVPPRPAAGGDTEWWA